MLLLIDNYDSFTYNLVQRLGEIDPTLEMRVVRNDKITPDEAESLAPSRLLISPGPCTPRETGVSAALIERFRGRIPILGVCLGHQAIADVAGMTVRRHDVLMHGKTSPIHHDGRGVFSGLPSPFVATRYHSLIVDRATVTGEFEISAWTDADEVMGLRWTGAGADAAPMEGVQFHPESFLTAEGPRLLANFVRGAGILLAVTSELQIDAIARAVLSHKGDGRIELSLPGTDYKLHLVPTVPLDEISTPVGKRIRGTIHAQALRIHAARGGGQFIEPVLGEPRIVAGVIVAVDDPAHRVLVRTAVPMWLTWQDGQDLGILRVGQLVNGHVQSGTRFEPL